MDISWLRFAYSAGSVVSLLVNAAVLVCAIIALQRRVRQSVVLIAIGCMVGILATCASLALYWMAPALRGGSPLFGLGLQVFFVLHHILWATGTILLFLEKKPDADLRS
ncbi:hypothetical protein BH09VER1_BH09VER1_43430 [soil metagenome]